MRGRAGAWLRIRPSAHYLYARKQETAILEHANVTVATSHVTRAEWIADHRRCRARAADHDLQWIRWPREGASNSGSDGEGERTPAAAGAEPGPLAPGRAAACQPIGDTSCTRELLLHAGGACGHIPARSGAGLRNSGCTTGCAARTGSTGHRTSFCVDYGIYGYSTPISRARLRVTFVGSGARRGCRRCLAETARRTWCRAGAVAARDSPSAGATGRRGAAHVRHGSRRAATTALPARSSSTSRRGMPILALLTDGAMRDLVSESGLGLLADPDDSRCGGGGPGAA